jgi:hypothetical protein
MIWESVADDAFDGHVNTPLWGYPYHVFAAEKIVQIESVQTRSHGLVMSIWGQ